MLVQGNSVCVDIGWIRRQVSGYLKESWVVTMKNAITNTFKDTGKGWFNVHKQSHEIHDFSKMKKFLMMTKFVMEDTLRFLVEDSLEKCASRLRRPRVCENTSRHLRTASPSSEQAAFDPTLKLLCLSVFACLFVFRRLSSSSLMKK